MLYFNYVANIIKFGICWDDGHVGICGGYAGHVVGMRDMRDGPPPRNRPGRAAVFWSHPPPTHEATKQERQTTSRLKKNAYFSFKLLIINDINQYFNIHLHLISFIIYNR